MTFCLVRYEILDTARKMHKLQANVRGVTDSRTAFEEMERELQRCRGRLQNEYFKYLELSIHEEQPSIWVPSLVLW